MQKPKSDPRVASRSLMYLVLDVNLLIGIYVILSLVQVVLPVILDSWKPLWQPSNARGIILAVRAVVPVAALVLVGKEWWLKNRQVAYTINRRVFMSLLFLSLFCLIGLFVCGRFWPGLPVKLHD